MERTPHFKDEFDFRDLLRHPEKLFGYAFFYVLLLLLALGIAYVNNLTVIGQNAVPRVAPPDSAAVIDIPLQRPLVLPPVDVARASVPTDSLLARGRELYRANCSSCHGDNGLGDGPAGIVMNPRPRNFHEASGWTNGAKISQIYKTLDEGIVRNGMASYNYLPPADRFALVHAVRSFHPSPPADGPEEIQGLETTYRLSKGSSLPGQIPVRRAEQLHLAETDWLRTEAASLSTLLRTSEDEGARLLAAYAAYPDRACASLLSHRSSIRSASDLMTTVLADPVGMGLKPSIAALDARGWEALYRFVMEPL